MGIDDLSGYTPELLAGLSGVIPDDYGLATSIYLAKLAKEYNIELANSLGIDVSTPEKYKRFVKSNPDAYKHPILKHQLGYGLLNPTIGGIIQAHVIKNKLNRLQSLDSSEINIDGRFYNMFNEILQAYKTCEDKTNFLEGQVPEEVRPEFLAALEAEDETKFNDLIDSLHGSDVVDEATEEAVEPNESEIQLGDQPEVPDTVADQDPNTIAPVPEEVGINEGTLPEGEVGTMLTEEQIDTVIPTLESVANMTEQVQNLENTEGIPESIKEGVEIWKDADEDFSVKIIAETVKRLHHHDFSEEPEVTEGDILKTGAEVAKDLYNQGEHKTSLTKGIEEVETDLKVMDLADLYSILGELKNLKESVINFVEFIAEKDDLGLSPSKKEELVDEILDNGLFVNGTDELKEDVAETLNSVADYSTKDLHTKYAIFKDFSEGFEEHIPELSDETRACLQVADLVNDAEKEAKEDTPAEEHAEDHPEAEGDIEPISDEAIEIAEEAGTVDKAIELVENRIEELQSDEKVLDGFAEFSLDCAAQVANANNIDPSLYLKLLNANSINRTPYQDLVFKKMLARERDYYKPKFFGGPGSKRYAKKYGNLDNTSTQVAYAIPSLLARYGYGTDLGDLILSENMHRNVGYGNFSEDGDFGFKEKLIVPAMIALLGLGAAGGSISGGVRSAQAMSPSYQQPAAAYVAYDNEYKGMGNNPYSVTVDDLNDRINVHTNKYNDYLNLSADTLEESKLEDLYKTNEDAAIKYSNEKRSYYNQALNELNKINDLKPMADEYKSKSDEFESHKNEVLANRDSVASSKNPKLFEKALSYQKGEKSPSGDIALATLGAVAGATAAGAGAAKVAKTLNSQEGQEYLKEEKKRRRRAQAKRVNSKGLKAGLKGNFSLYDNIKITPKRNVDVDGDKVRYDDLTIYDKHVTPYVTKGIKDDSKVGPRRDFAENEAQVQEQIPQEVIDNALSNDDQIRALVEKFKMLPTVEAKEQMKADMQTLGFGDDVIAMIEQYAEGNFSEEEEVPAVEGAPADAPETKDETVDVASMVAPELFDELLGPGVGETDPVDGTLPAGEVEAPGTELGSLGTLDQGIPSGEVVPEEDKTVTKVEIVNSDAGADGDEFESIMR